MRTTDELRILDTDLETTECELDQAAELLAADPDRESTPEVEQAMWALRAALKAAQGAVVKARRATDREYAAALAEEEAA